MRAILLFLMLIFTGTSFAQKLEYQVQFYGFGDNREFQSQVANSQSILAERTSFALGTTP